MVSIVDLWLPIVVAAVLVFVVSSILHMVFAYHKSDFRQLPNEAETLAGLRRAGLTPGMYFFPFCSSNKEMATPEAMEKYKQGPVGMMTVMPSGPPAMGKLLVLWFLFSLLVGVFVAYLTGRTLAAGTHYLTVFRVAGTAAFLAYGLGHISDGIWRGQSWSATIKAVVDGLIYGLVTAGAFGWLWPR